MSDPIYDKLRHAGTRYESTTTAEDSPVKKYQAEVSSSRAYDCVPCDNGLFHIDTYTVIGLMACSSGD
jgi:hypothetical protein